MCYQDRVGGGSNWRLGVPTDSGTRIRQPLGKPRMHKQPQAPNLRSLLSTAGILRQPDLKREGDGARHLPRECNPG